MASTWLKAGISSLTAKQPPNLTRETVAALEASEARNQPSFLLVPDEQSSAAATAASTARSLSEALPQVWQDLFAAARASQSTDYLDGLACRPPLPQTPAGSAGRHGSDESSSTDATTAQGASGGSGSRDPTLGITKESIFVEYLAPESLVRRHHLGKPEVRRVYQALQVYSLGFHQTMLEVTRHAAGKGLLLLALWRAFAMLWDGALQVVFPADTVQTSQERQAALLAGEELRQMLEEEQAKSAAFEQENIALKQQMEGMVVQMLHLQAEATVAIQSTAGLEQQLRAAAMERVLLTEQLDDRRRELFGLQDKLAALSGPQEGLFNKAQQLERLLKEKQGQLSAAAKQAAQALAAKEEAQQGTWAERLRREAAEQQAQQLQEELDSAKQRLQAAGAEAEAWREQEQRDAAARADGAAQVVEARAELEHQAQEAAAEAERLRAQLAGVQQQLEAERVKNEELVASLWPLAAKVKVLEAAAAGS